MLEMNICIYIREQISRKKPKCPPVGLKISGNGLKETWPPTSEIQYVVY